MTEHRARPFLVAFNDIEGFLREALHADAKDGFTWMAKQARRQGLVSGAQEDMLKDFAYLRNAISHGEYYGNQPIAEPAQQVVEDIQSLRDLLLNPPVALSVLKPQHVALLEPGSPISEALEVIAEKDYSQLPVYSAGKFQQLLTTHVIAKWVASEARGDGTLESTTVGEVLKYARPPARTVFLPRQASALELIEALSVVSDDGSRAFAAIITEAGHRDQKPLRIVTAADLSELFKAVS
ncbi:hypothetical protein CPHO_05550 [Corynebacterium phocae]|uniref:CBS domain-containing protein n=1 Tax=Corynebacterium phocae TaxID=161895 RepID=A0A1L7D2W7_9CORY|nr:CBS domain-containing protein [Corynebacterium phocae]APT92435.1 hypothetical protein CPHO_05550 [Corynebacterium phocae]KAA8725036.1 CBS domain-containing protein [Corynebacterium phocae]